MPMRARHAARHRDAFTPAKSRTRAHFLCDGVLQHLLSRLFHGHFTLCAPTPRHASTHGEHAAKEVGAAARENTQRRARSATLHNSTCTIFASLRPLCDPAANDHIHTLLPSTHRDYGRHTHEHAPARPPANAAAAHLVMLASIGHQNQPDAEMQCQIHLKPARHA